ncbi:MAG: carboxypeptidase regulatory-like domain-containing protein [Anaerolineae bacterium]|nr:carboxypeptidase regulatory-like domain-containing protein [Anaerolineae bacterium]
MKSECRIKYTPWPRILAATTIAAVMLACSTTAPPSPTLKPTVAPSQTPVPTWTPTPQPTTGEISGQVIDSANGFLVPSANVYTIPPTVSVTADEQGRYLIPEVFPGIYTITAAKPGYTGAGVSITVNAGKTTTADIHLTVEPTATSIPTPQLSLTDGLVAYYPFNGNANDRSESGNHGIVHGATLTMDRFENADSAYSFDGVDDYIVSSSDISLNTTYSVLLWFNYTQSATPGTLFHRGYKGWCWYEPNINISETATLRAFVTGCEGKGMIGASDVTPGRWYHVAVVIQRNSQRLYVNGEQISSSKHHPIAFAYQAFLGVSANQNTPVGTYFQGAIDDVRIYNRALGELEIQALYRQ